MSVETELHEALLQSYTLAGNTANYWGNYFLRELRKKGGLVTAKRLLTPTRSAKIAPGLQALIDAGCPELSVEAVCLQPKFRVLFSDAELVEASKRLDALPSFAKKRPVPPGENFSGELADDSGFVEGAKKQVLVNAYERDAKARAACLAKYGFRCAVCSMSFAERYGEIGKGFSSMFITKSLLRHAAKSMKSAPRVTSSLFAQTAM
jgi:5-methylcytosine-specific restriction protein A